jgi:hypothetical protein
MELGKRIDVKNVFVIFLVFSCYLTFGQENDNHPFLKRKPGIMRLYTGLSAPDENTPIKFDRFNTDVFFNSWFGETAGVETKFYSLGHNINLMFDIPFSKTSRFGIGIGFGYSHFSVRHNGDFSFIENENGAYTIFNSYIGPKRWINRTVFNFLEVPFEFRIRSQKERGKWKFYPGFKASFMVENYMKWRIEKLEFKDFNFSDLNRLHYGPTLRIGRDNIFIFGAYDMTYLFTHASSNQLQLFSAGISIGWF